MQCLRLAIGGSVLNQAHYILCRELALCVRVVASRDRIERIRGIADGKDVWVRWCAILCLRDRFLGSGVGGDGDVGERGGDRRCHGRVRCSAWCRTDLQRLAHADKTGGSVHRRGIHRLEEAGVGRLTCAQKLCARLRSRVLEEGFGHVQGDPPRFPGRSLCGRPSGRRH